MPIPLNISELFTGNPERQQFIRDDPLALRQAIVGYYGRYYHSVAGQ